MAAVACGRDSSPTDQPPTGPAAPFVPEIVSRVAIGALPGHSQSVPLGLNENGEVVGYSVAGDGPLHAFHWSEAAGMLDLGEGSANDVSDFGEIVGGHLGRAILWEPVGTGWSRISLPPLEEPRTSGRYSDMAAAVDRLGQFVAGSSSPDLGRRPDGTPRVGQVPVVWRQLAGAWDVLGLPMPAEMERGAARGVNSAGVAVGFSSYAFPAPPKAVVWRPGSAGYSVEQLPPVNAGESWALAIGEDGRVAGFVGEVDGPRIGVVWTPVGTGWRVDSIGPDEARGINDSGLVVGEVTATGTFFQGAWMWTSAGGLASLGPGDAIGVNGRNEVIGSSEYSVAVLWRLSRP